MCRVCKAKFDTEKLSKDEWVMPNPKFYYHRKCYEDWKDNKDNLKASNKDGNFWYESLIDYLYKDIKMTINFSKLNKQWKTFTAPTKGMTPKGIYFSIRYYYDVLHGKPEKALGGIGIVSNIYNEAASYWIDLENKKEGTLEKIIAQIQNREARPVMKISSKKQKKEQKERWNLEDI